MYYTSFFSKIQRLNYPQDEWPVVHKKRLINYYDTQKETYPISALKIATGRGFETKHWYEISNERYMQNSVWGHPIMFGYKASDDKWNDKCTLNPLGAKYKTYYGLTMLYKPGDIIKLDTRGYDREKIKKI